MILSRHSKVRLSALFVVPFLVASCAEAKDSSEKKEDTKQESKETGSKAGVSSDEKSSYVLGRNIGENFSRDGIKVNAKTFLEGLSSALDGTESKYSATETAEIMGALQKEVMTKRQAVNAAAGEKNAAAGKEFLEKNKSAEGVKTTASGLQYKIVKEGSGASPAATDTVVAHYRGTLLNGTEFDSSYKRGQPAEFKVNGLIKGWQEALQLMKPGAKWELVVPPELAYGAQGTGGGPIGPNETLKFEIELISIKK